MYGADGLPITWGKDRFSSTMNMTWATRAGCEPDIAPQRLENPAAGPLPTDPGTGIARTATARAVAAVLSFICTPYTTSRPERRLCPIAYDGSGGRSGVP